MSSNDISITGDPASELIPSSTNETANLAPIANKATSKATIEIPALHSYDEGLTTDLADLVNDVYTKAESGIYKTSFSRTSPNEIQTLLKAGKLAVAFLPSEAGTGALPRKPVGCVCIKELSATTGEFGMLAVRPSYRGAGLGGDLVRFAEEHCRDVLGLPVMRLDLLVPKHFEHADKTRLQLWYTRLGYETAGLGDFEQEYPDLHALLSGPTDYRIFEKKLVASEDGVKSQGQGDL